MRLYEKLVFRYRLGYWPNIKKPVSFCEKIIWRKLYSRDKRYIALSDKVSVREFVRERCGDEYLTKLYSVLSDSSELPDWLPPDFFMKAAYGSGINMHVTNFALDRRSEIMSIADDMLRQEHVYGRLSSQWWYESVPKRVLLEEVLIDSKHCLPSDYKFYCFDGTVRLIHVDFDRFGSHTRSHFDRHWNFLPYSSTYPQGAAKSRPGNLEEMIDIAEALARDFDFVRVDLYNIDDVRIVFGEMTFAPDAGLIIFSPTQAPDWEIGRLWKLDCGGSGLVDDQ